MRSDRWPGLPPDAFTVVMATGIVAVAARDAGFPAVAAVLAVLAAAVMGVLGLVATVGLVVVGRAVGPGPGPVTGALMLFSAVAACDVVAAALGARPVGVSVALGVVAALGWVLLVARTVVVLRSRPRDATEGTRGDGGRGAWLLGAVATESLALTAARLARAGVAPPVLVRLAVGCWVLGVGVYLVTAVPIVRRLCATRAHPDVLTPDTWVLMGGLAIATVSGSTVALAAVPTIPGLPPVVAPALLVLWGCATAWIPFLLAAEVRRARCHPPHYERARWSTVFPVGMYSAACAVVVAALGAGRAGGPALLAVVDDLGRVAFGVALPLWAVVALGLARHGWRTVRARP